MPRGWGGASNSPPLGSCPLEGLCCPLEGLCCPCLSPDASAVALRPLVPDPPHTHVFVLSVQSQCQAVTSTLLPGTRCSAERNGAEGEGGAAGESTNPAVFQEDESLPRPSSAMLYLLPLHWYEGRLPCPCAASLGPATPLIRRGHWAASPARWWPLAVSSSMKLPSVKTCFMRDWLICN